MGRSDIKDLVEQLDHLHSNERFVLLRWESLYFPCLVEKSSHPSYEVILPHIAHTHPHLQRTARLQLSFDLIWLISLETIDAVVSEVEHIFLREAAIFVMVEAIQITQMVEVDLELIVLSVEDVVQSEVGFILRKGGGEETADEGFEAKRVVSEGGAHY